MAVSSIYTTFPGVLRDNGYRTVAVGKMHMNPTYQDIGFSEMKLAEQNGILAVLGGNVLSQHLQTVLGSGVGGNGFTTQLAHHGADVDDLAAALLDHIGNDRLGDDEGGVQVHVDDLTELGSGHLNHRGCA